MKRGKRGARGKMASCAWWALLRDACATQLMADRHLVIGDDVTALAAEAHSHHSGN